MKNLVILGSTGSIGKSTLDVVRHFSDQFRVIGLSARNNFRLLAQQAKEFGVRHVGIAGTHHFKELRSLCPGRVIHAGEDSYKNLCNLPRIDMVVSAIVGAEGLMPTYTALMNGQDIALANKESLVMAGDVIMPLAKKKGCSITPIDSEHSAIWNLLQIIHKEHVEKATLTASGGPFFRTPLPQLRKITVEQALRHPTWNMGAKITVDSATMMNKGFEVIEAHHLFGMPFDRIEVIIHPESLIHSMVKSDDGMFYAQIGPHDMKFPILSALTHGNRLKNTMKNFGMDQLAELGKMTFFKPDLRKFPLLEMAYEIGRKGGILPAVLTVADDVAVRKFLAGEIGFMGIHRYIRKETDRYASRSGGLRPDIGTILGIIKEVAERGKS